MRGKLKKRFISVLLVITLLLSVLPLSAITASAATYSGITIGTYTSMTKATFESKIANYNYVLLFYKSDASSTYTEAKFRELYKAAKAKGKGVGVIMTQTSNESVYKFLANTTDKFQFDYPIYLRYSTSTSSGLSFKQFSDYCNKYKLYGGVYGGSNQNCKDGLNAGLKSAYYGYGTSTDYDMCSTSGNTWPAIGTFPTSKTTVNLPSKIKAAGLNGYSSTEEPTTEPTTTTPPSSSDVDDEFYAYINVHGGVNSEGYENHYRTLSVEADVSKSNIIAKDPDYKNPNQIWHFTKPKGQNYYYIQNYKTKEYIFAEGTAQYDNIRTTPTVNAIKARWIVGVASDNTNYSEYQPLYTFILNENKSFLLSNIKATKRARLESSATSSLNYNKKYIIEKIQMVEDGSEFRIQSKGYNSGSTRLTESDTALSFDSVKSVSATDFDKQFWKFVSTNSDTFPPTFNIINRQTGKCLEHCAETDGGTHTLGANAIQSKTPDGSDAQKWILLGDDRSEVKIIPYCCSQKTFASAVSATYGTASDVIPCLCAPTDTNTNAIIHESFKSSLIYFNLESVNPAVDIGDFYTSINPYASESFAVSAGVDGKGATSTGAVGAVMRSVTDTPAVDQMWYFKSLGDKTYIIENLATGTALTATDSGVELKEYSGNNDSKWVITKLSNGYGIVNAADTTYNSKYLNLAATAANESTLSLGAVNTTWVLDVGNTVAPPSAENLGDSFYAYIYNPNLSGYLHCANTTDTTSDATKTTATLSVVTGLNNTTRQEQENYWKFERNADGSYTINSSNVQYAVMNAYDDGTVKTVKKIATADIGTDYASVYSQRWFIRKYGTSYKLEAKGNGKVLDFTSTSSIKFSTNTETSFGDDSVKQLCDIIKTDCSVNTEMPNVKLNLFDYGQEINTYANAVLPFSNGTDPKDYDDYVDGFSKDTNASGKGEIPINADTKVTMAKTLNSDGYPQVTDNGRKYKYDNSDQTKDYIKKLTQDDFYETKTKGSLQYLFDASAGFVKGDNGKDSGYSTGGNSYQSQHFTVESPKGLFKLNPNNGMYYYDSLLNSAYFQRNKDESGNLTNTGNFKLYDYTTSLVHPKYKENVKTNFSSVTGRSAESGNFFPFNLSCEEGDVFYGNNTRGATSTAIGVRPTVTAPTNDYVTNGKNVPVNYRLSNSKSDESKKIDAWFGMTMECDFQMTKDGTYNGKPMEFKFQGDDDVWVYLDGVLILDMGGTHGAQTGTINFNTGEVYYQQNDGITDGSWTENKKTLKELYEEALTEAGGTYTYNGTTITNDNTKDNYYGKLFNGNTFAANTKHKLSFYYLERGGYVSYCQLQFNLPKGSVGVSKKVEGLDSELKDPRTYNFQLQDGSGNAFMSGSLTELHYIYEKADGTTSEEKLPIGGTNDCKFTLKDGESVIFNDIPDGAAYNIVELDKPSGTTTTVDVTKGGATQEYSENTTFTADSSQFTQFNFNNAVPVNSLKLVTKVLDPYFTFVDEMPNSTYYLGLHIFDKDENGNIVNDYGTKVIPVSGATELNEIKELTGLPSGASYELWEYTPDDTDNVYENPKLSDANGIKDYTASTFVEKDTTPDSDALITGSVSGQTLTVVNKLVADSANTVTVTFKYYDREMETSSGKPANINSVETTYSKLVDITDNAYNNYVKYDDTSNTYKIKDKTIFGNMIADVGATATGKIDNVVDTYELFTSQQTAVNYMLNAKPTYTLGASDNYATHYFDESNAPYHTNSKRQPTNNDTNHEKWVTYITDDGTIVDPEKDNSVDLNSIKSITVWLYNRPKTYTVTTHVPDGNGGINEIAFSGYYNQQLGVYSGNDMDECKEYCELYSIPLAEYDARGIISGSTEKTYEKSGALPSINITPTVENKNTSADGNYSVSSNKKVYFQDEAINVTAISNITNDKDWVGIYKKGESFGGNYLKYYYLTEAGGNNKEFNIKNAKAEHSKGEITPGEYTIAIFDNNSYNVKASIDITVISENEFSYWTDKEQGGNILSVDRNYLYRITKTMDLYANYGATPGNGVVSTNEGIDVYYDGNGTKKLRVNTMMNPYGFEFGEKRGNKNITYAAAAYLTFTDPSTTLSDVSGGVNGIKDSIKATAADLADNMGNYTKGTKSFSVTNDSGETIGTVKVIVYKTNNGELLTNKNRIQFMASYTPPANEKNVYVFTSLNYEETGSELNNWYVSDNYVTHTLNSNIGMSSN